MLKDVPKKICICLTTFTLFACAPAYEDSNRNLDAEKSKKRAECCGTHETPELLKDKPFPHRQQIFRDEVLANGMEYLPQAARAANAVYANEPPEGWTMHRVPRPKLGTGEVESIYITKINHESRTLEIAVRGTNNIDDAYIDMQSRQDLSEMTGTSFHAGFQLIAVSIYESLLSEYGTEIKNGYSIQLYGHSLGGAVASIVSMLLYQNDANIAFVATLAPPDSPTVRALENISFSIKSRIALSAVMIQFRSFLHLNFWGGLTTTTGLTESTSYF